MKAAQDIIIKPIVTERSMDALQERKYTFKVAKDANKIEIKAALKELFDVDVQDVRTMNVKGHEKRMGRYTGFRPDWKKAVVTLTENSKTIEFFDGMM